MATRRIPGTLLREVGLFLAALVPAAVGYGLQRLADRVPAVGEFHASRVFPILSWPVRFLSSLVPFSLAELLAVLALPATLVLLALWIRRIVRSRPRWRPLVTGLRSLVLAGSCALLAFMLFHGINYARLPLADSADLSVRERSADELLAASLWLAEGVRREADLVRTGPDGAMRLSGDIQATLKEAAQGYDAVSADFPGLSGPWIRPKGVLLSHYWSYTGITGMYFPFTIEANVNIDVPDWSIPVTTLHEIAHTRGFAREDEANFLAFLTAIHHPSADFRYSGYLFAFVNCANALYGIDADRGREAYDALPATAFADLSRNAAYWKQFEGPVRETSTKVNDAYLQANLQEDGVRSYGRMVDLVLAYRESESGTTP